MLIVVRLWILVNHFTSFVSAAQWMLLWNSTTSCCLYFLSTISNTVLRGRHYSCGGSNRFSLAELLPFMPEVPLLRDMFLAPFSISIIKNFELRARALHICLMKLFVVHDPRALWSNCKVFGLIATKIRCNLASYGIHFCKSRATRH